MRPANRVVKQSITTSPDHSTDIVAKSVDLDEVIEEEDESP